MAAPPSRHPITGKLYEVEKTLDILRVPDLAELVAWIEAFKPRQPDEGWQPPKHLPPLNSTVNPELVATIADRLRQLRHKERGEWINWSVPIDVDMEAKYGAKLDRMMGGLAARE